MFRIVRVNQWLVDWSISTTIGRLWRHWFLRLSPCPPVKIWETGTESKFDETSQHLEDLCGFRMTLILLICYRCFPLEEPYCPLAFPFILSNSLVFSLPVSLVLLFSPHHICLTAELVFSLCLLWHPLSFLPLSSALVLSFIDYRKGLVNESYWESLVLTRLGLFGPSPVVFNHQNWLFSQRSPLTHCEAAGPHAFGPNKQSSGGAVVCICKCVWLEFSVTPQ